MPPLLLSGLLLISSLFFFFASRVLLRIKSMRTLIQQYRAGKVSLFEQIFFLNIEFFPALFDRAVEVIGDKAITRLLHLFGYFLMMAGIMTVASSVIVYITLS